VSWPGTSAIARRACVASGVGGLAAHALLFACLQGSFCIDDAYISFRFARNLAAGVGLVFNPGEAVEGYTNFGWVLLLGLASKLGLDLTMTASVASMLSACVLAAGAVDFLFARSARPVAASALLAGLLMADGSLARWAQDGMETVCFALAVFSGASLAVRESEADVGLPLSAVVFALAALVRPEGLLFFMVTFAWSLGGRSIAWTRTFRSAALFAALYGSYFLWRFVTYGMLLPNTFYAKVGVSEAQLSRGGVYVAEFFFAGRWPLLVLAVVAIGLKRTRWAPWHKLFVALAASNAVAAALVGGDWMGSGRFLLPTLAPLYVVTADVVVGALAGGAIWAPVCAATVAASFVLTSWRGEQRSVRAERPYLESRAVVGSWLARHARAGDSLLTNEIGELAFFSGLRTDDLHGLTDPHIAHLSIPAIGAGKPGHEKYDLAYSLDKRPTWMVLPTIAMHLEDFIVRYPELTNYRIEEVAAPIPRREYGMILHRLAGPVRRATPN